MFATRDEILQYAKSNNISWREDQSNIKVTYHRNRIRPNIVPELRNKALGTKFAKLIFYKYPGKWQVRQLPSLDKARRFWLKAIKESKAKDFLEELDNPNWQGFLQSFTIGENA